MGTKLERIAEISATTPKPEFTSLYHLINAEMLMQCHKELDGKKAVGIDRVTKAEYEEHLEENITNLVKLKTSRKKYAQKLKATKEWLYANNDLPVKELIEKLNKKLGSFLHFTQRYLCKALNRRSQKKSYIWDGFADMLKVYSLAKPKIYVRLF